VFPNKKQAHVEVLNVSYHGLERLGQLPHQSTFYQLLQIWFFKGRLKGFKLCILLENESTQFLLV
jgi:hypothetical protein